MTVYDRSSLESVIYKLVKLFKRNLGPIRHGSGIFYTIFKVKITSHSPPCFTIVSLCCGTYKAYSDFLRIKVTINKLLLLGLLEEETIV